VHGPGRGCRPPARYLRARDPGCRQEAVVQPAWADWCRAGRSQGPARHGAQGGGHRAAVAAVQARDAIPRAARLGAQRGRRAHVHGRVGALAVGQRAQTVVDGPLQARPRSTRDAWVQEGDARPGARCCTRLRAPSARPRVRPASGRAATDSATHECHRPSASWRALCLPRLAPACQYRRARCSWAHHRPARSLRLERGSAAA
jgi:hypothetical protein